MQCKNVKESEALNPRGKIETMRGGHPLVGTLTHLCYYKNTQKIRKTPHKSCSISATYVKIHVLFYPY